MTHALKIRPLAGEVLLYMDPPDTSSDGGIIIPQKHQARSQFGQVRRLGIWKQNRWGALIPFPCQPGDRVMVRAASGRWLHSERERLKLVDANDILAVIQS